MVVRNRSVRSRFQKRRLHLLHSPEIPGAREHQRRLAHVIFAVHIRALADRFLHDHVNNTIPAIAPPVQGGAGQPQQAVALIVDAVVRIKAIPHQKIHQLFRQPVLVELFRRVYHNLLTEQRGDSRFPFAVLHRRIGAQPQQESRHFHVAGLAGHRQRRKSRKAMLLADRVEILSHTGQSTHGFLILFAHRLMQRHAARRDLRLCLGGFLLVRGIGAVEQSRKLFRPRAHGQLIGRFQHIVFRFGIHPGFYQNHRTAEQRFQLLLNLPSAPLQLLHGNRAASLDRQGSFIAFFFDLLIDTLQSLDRIPAGLRDQMQARVPVLVCFGHFHAALCQSAQKFIVALLRGTMIAEHTGGIPAHGAGFAVEQSKRRAVDIPFPRDIVVGESFLRQKKQRNISICGRFVRFQPLFQQPGHRLGVGILAGNVKQIHIPISFCLFIKRTLLIRGENLLRIRSLLVGSPNLENAHFSISFCMFSITLSKQSGKA